MHIHRHDTLRLRLIFILILLMGFSINVCGDSEEEKFSLMKRQNRLCHNTRQAPLPYPIAQMPRFWRIESCSGKQMISTSTSPNGTNLSTR